MCDPVTLTAVSTGLAVASTAAQVQGQRQQAKYAKQAATVERNANVAAIQAEQNMRQQDEADKVEALRREAEAKAATARASAAESGVQGISVDAVLNELSGQAGEALQNLETNYARAGLGTSAELSNAEYRRQDTIARNPGPNYLAAGLQIGGQLAGGYADYKTAKAKAGGTK